MLLQPQPGLVPDSMMSVMSMYRYMLQGPSTDASSPMELNTGPQPPVAHRHGMANTLPSSVSAHSIFNPSPTPHSPIRTQSGPESGPNSQDVMSSYTHHGTSSLNNSLTQVSNGSGPGGLVVPTPTRQRTIKSYHCRMCDQEFEHKNDMHRHAKEVHGLEEKGHKCPHCFKLFPSSQQLGQHSLVHTNLRKYTCKFCDKTFKQLSHVQQHQRIHTGEKPYKCPGEECEKAFAQLSNLQNHMKQHEKEANGSGPRDLKKPFSCHVCQRRFATESSLNNHISKLHSAVAQPHDLTCQVCEKQCYSTDKFYKHMHKYHPDYWRVFAGDRPLSDFINPEVRHREKPFMCQICNKKYSHETGLSKHLITHPEYRNDPNFKGAELFNCPVCEKFFTRENYLERHMEMKHDEEHSRAYEIYKQKYVRKPHPEIVESSNRTDHQVTTIDQSASAIIQPSVNDENPINPTFSIHVHNGHSQRGSLPSDITQGTVHTSSVRTETVSRPPESPSDSEMDDIQTKPNPVNDSHILPSNSESFHSDTSFERSSPLRQQSTSHVHGDAVINWQGSNSARTSPRYSNETQHQPYDMSQRQEYMPSSKSQHHVPVRSASVSLPVFPEPFDRYVSKDKDSANEQTRSHSSRSSYLHRQMASLDEEHLLRQSSNEYADRSLSHGDSQAVTYEQFVRDHLMDDHRSSEKVDFIQRNNQSKHSLHRSDNFMRPQLSVGTEERRAENFFSHRESTDEQTNGHDDYTNRSKVISKNNTNNTHLMENNNHPEIDRHFTYSRSPGHDTLRSHLNQEHTRIIPANEESRYDYAPYGAHGLLSQGAGTIGRERLSGQFPFNIPSSSLQPSNFPHPMSPRSSIGGQYPPLAHRSEEEVAQALESLARAMRPAFR